MRQNHKYLEFLSTALRIVEAAGDLIQSTDVWTGATRKTDGTLVTGADRAASRLITDLINAAYPDHRVLSEEDSTIYDSRTEFTWIVDPLDGTTNYARGLPIWGVSLGLLEGGNPVAGVLAFPLLRETFAATLGGGATRNGVPLTTAPLQAPDDEHFMALCSRTGGRYRITTPLKPRILGSAAYHLAKVADGSLVAAIEATPKVWDIAAALLVLEEAGGVAKSLSQITPIFPLPPGVRDYRDTSFSLLAGANLALVDAVISGLAVLD
jgi:myo-inositol-1(or 4)-monophosphatase